MATAQSPARVRRFGTRLGASVALATALLVGTANMSTAAARHHAATARAQGTVIARNFARHTLVIARAGVAHTLRFGSPRPVASARLGSTLVATVTPLADGTDKASSIRVIGHARRVRVKATVVASSRAHLVLSAAGSVFSVGALGRPAPSRRAHLATRAPAPGEVVDATLAVSTTSVQPASVQPVGQASLIDLQGVLSEITSASIVVNATAGAITTISLPASLSLPPTIAVGDQVEVVAAYGGATFSLVTIVDDTLAAASSATASSPAPASQDGSSQSVEIEGIVVSTPSASGSSALTGTASTLTATATTGAGGALVIQPGDHAAPVSLAVPAGDTLPTLAIGARVHAVADMSGGVLTLLRLSVQQSSGSDGAPQSAPPTSPATSGGTPTSCPPGNQGSGHGGDHAVGADHGGGCGSSGDN